MWLGFDPSIGVEPKKTRTCVVVSNDAANTHGAAITVVPTIKYAKERSVIAGQHIESLAMRLWKRKSRMRSLISGLRWSL